MRAFTPPDVSRPPFAVPAGGIVIVVDLPRPPSLNHIWKYGRKGVRPSPLYERWKAHADVLALLQHTHRGLKPITGRFTAELLIADSRKPLDCDNAAKGPLDWAQSRRLIANDKFCRRLVVEFVEASRAKHGARLTLTEIVSRETVGA